MAVERTLVLIKPDGVKRQLIGSIISRFERAGLKIVALKMVRATPEQVMNFYPSSEEYLRSLGEKAKKGYARDGLDIKEYFGTEDPLEIGKAIKKDLVNYICSGPIVAMVVEGNRAVEVVRKIVGFTEPFSAAPGTIRGDFSIVSFDWANSELRAMMNVVHASGNREEAEYEINFWFKPEEIHSYEAASDKIWKEISEYVKSH